MKEFEVQEILSKISVFDKLYEQIRFVDPASNKVISKENDMLIEEDSNCFAFWNKSKVCGNCISMRALNENDTFVKFEYTGDKFYMITALPLEMSGRRIVIELLKDATQSMLYNSSEGDGGKKSEIHSMIDNMNSIAMKDGLLGIYNKRYINEKLPVDLLNAALLEQELSLVIVDIDFFKKVNDTYGHVVGDCALKSFAETLSGCLKRESDWIARFGGEEFLVCLPGAGLEKTIELSELMRRTVEEKEFLCGENSFKLTASFGICNCKPNQSDNIEALIQRADAKLYLAKNNGRNRVEY